MNIQSKFFLASFVFLISTLSISNAHAKQPVTDIVCNHEDYSQLAMNECAYVAFYKEDDELNLLYKEKIGSLKNVETRNRFKNSQLAWIKYRDASCLYENGPKENSGSIWPLVNFRCMSSFTKERIVRLKEYIGCTDNGCPE